MWMKSWTQKCWMAAEVVEKTADQEMIQAGGLCDDGRETKLAYTTKSPDASVSLATAWATRELDKGHTVESFDSECIQNSSSKMTLDDLQPHDAHKWPCKTRIGTVIDSLPKTTNLGKTFDLIFQAYKRAFLKVLADSSIPTIRSKLCKQLIPLNLELETNIKDKDIIAGALARAKSTALLRRN